ncbi:MAG: NAD(P)H-dependent oxidoreductase [Muribaculaceae bacterium]|nr:NAD(P)H-dependent oxidoreductase [Muribaculaceae bacterium]
MKKIITSIFTLLAVCLVACASTKDGKASEESNDSKTLVAYFSAQGHTKALAEKISTATDGVLFEIEPENPYTEEDLDGWNESARGTRESKDRSTRPAVKNRVENFEQYDTIYLGFPIWWFTAPTIVNTFLEQYDTEGKVIVPFATSGGSPIGETEKDLKVSAPKAKFVPGKVINNATQEEVNEWIKIIKK